MFNFPSSPTSGQIFTPAGGPTYQFNGVSWTSITQGVPVTVTVSDTPPVSPAFGQLWWNSATGNTAIWYQDADSAQWVQISGAVSATKTADAYNRVVNGAMQHSQENSDTGSGALASHAGYYMADQWVGQWSVTPGTLTAQRASSSLTPGGNRSITLVTGTTKPSLAAGDYALMTQFIEGQRVFDLQWGTATAKSLVVRFYVNATTTGKYSFRLANSANDRSYVHQFDIVSGWNLITAIVPGDKAGTWLLDTGIGIRFSVCPAAGSTFVTSTVDAWQAGAFFAGPAQANAVAAAGNVWIGDVGLYLDPNNTGAAPAWVTPDYASELATCKRYWMQLGLVVDTATTWGSVSLPVEMRVNPAITGAGAGFTNNGPNTTVFNCYQTSRATQTIILSARM